jgi:hypothetical protein
VREIDPGPTISMSPSDEPRPAPADNTVALEDAPASAPEPGAQAEFAQFKPKPRRDSSVFLIIALIFLVPYALTMTFFVVFLLMFRNGGGDPLEYLRDPMPSPKEGGPRKVQRKQPEHTLPVAAARKTTIGKSVKAGDLLVTPQRLTLTGSGDLKLILRVRNTSAKTAFTPMHDSYVNERKFATKPYTFIESRSSSLDNIYGGYLAFFKKADASGDPESFPVLAPNEEITIVLETDEKYRSKFVSVIANSTKEEYTWRVQVRRGFVRVDNKDVSATTVIGVDFTSKEIEREGKS